MCILKLSKYVNILWMRAKFLRVWKSSTNMDWKDTYMHIHVHIHTYISSYVHLRSFRGNDTPVAVRTSSAQILVSITVIVELELRTYKITRTPCYVCLLVARLRLILGDPSKKDRSYQKDAEDNLKRLSLVKTGTGSSLAAQWLGPHASAAGGTGLIAAQGTKIWHATLHSQKQTNKQKPR